MFCSLSLVASCNAVIARDHQLSELDINDWELEVEIE